jgi:hypothetical protein
MQDFFMWIGGFVITFGAAITGWAFKMIYNLIKDGQNSHEKLKDELSNHKLHAAETFATKADVQSGFEKIMLKLENISSKFDKFEERLSKKADKRTR